ncbi:hypothetical protein OFEAOIEE_LOCUS209 [Methylorubrum extorquens]
MNNPSDKPIHFRWVESKFLAIISPESDPAEAVYIKGKDLSEFREWLKGELGSRLTYAEQTLKTDPANIYENLVMLFKHDELGTHSYKEAKKGIMILRTAVGEERNWTWEVNFSDATV